MIVKQRRPEEVQRLARLWMLGFAVLWTGVTLPLDVVVGWQLRDQARTAGFSAANGVITYSHTGIKGRFGVRFTYRVNGVDYTGDKYQFMNTWFVPGAYTKAAAYPVGAKVRVYYDPNQPQESLLVSGVNGNHLFICLFLTPFNTGMVLLWMATVAVWRRRAGVAALQERRSLTGASVQLAEGWALAVALIVVGFMSFAAIFVVLAVGPSMGLLAGVFTAILVAGAVTWLVVVLGRMRGTCDLTVDLRERQIVLPRRWILGPRRSVRIVDVVEAYLHERSGPLGAGSRAYPSLKVRTSDGSVREVRMARFDIREKGQALVEWVKDKISEVPRASHSLTDLDPHAIRSFQSESSD